MRAHGRRPETGEPNRVFYAKTWLNWKKSADGILETKGVNLVSDTACLTPASAVGVKKMAPALRRGATFRGLDEAYLPAPGALKYLKKSEFGSTTITSALERKEAR